MSGFKTVLLLITIILLCSKPVYGQSPEIKNELFKGANFILYAGENDTYVYKLLLSDTVEKKKVKLIAVNKKNRKLVIGLPLKGVPKKEDDYKELDFHTCVVQDRRIVICWSKNTNDSEELYLESYDDTLHKTQSVQKVYTNFHAHDLERFIGAKKKSSIVVCPNPYLKNEIFIGGEIPVKNNYIQLEYGILEDDLLIPPFKKIKLPIQLKTKSIGKSSTYEFLENGNLLMRCNFTAEDGKGYSENIMMGGILLADVNPYHTISYLDIDKNEITTVEIKTIKASLYEVPIHCFFVGDELRIYGLAKDVNDKSKKLTGLFYAGINTSDLSNIVEFIPFEQELLDAMYEEKSSKPYSINSIKMKDENILIFMSDGTAYQGAAFVTLEYTVDHRLLRFGSERDF